MVKSVNHHLKGIIGDGTLPYEELSTLLSQMEACLNSRPLQAIFDDPDDLSPLTTQYFVIGLPLNTVPKPSLLNVKISPPKRWALVQKMFKDFRNR